jgi:hypothetical protein
LVFLSEDQQKANYAYCLNSSSENPKPDERTVKQQLREEAKQDKNYDILMAELDAKLKEARSRLEEPKIKTPHEQKQDSFDKFYAGAMAVPEIARKKKAEKAIEYKDFPDLLADSNAAIDEWVRRNV